MDDRTKTKVAISIIIVILILLIGGGIMIFTKKKAISPIPENTGIKIMFVSPTSIPLASSSAMTITPTIKP